ncbi:MAG: glycosyltransferase family 4 protein [Candidatus Helarchaeota archaeon]
MKVALVHPYFPPHLGGGEIHTKNLALNLAKLNFKTYVFTANIPKGKFIDFFNDNLTIYKINPVFVFSGTDPIFFKHLSLIKKLKINLIHVHGHLFLISLLTILYAKINKIPTILTLHNLSIGKNTFHNLILRIRFILQSIPLFKMVKKIIVLTESQKGLLLKYHVNKNKIIVFPNAVDIEKLEKFNPNDKEISSFNKKFDIANKKILLFVGRLMYQKNPEIIIKVIPELIEQYPNLILFLVGTGPQYNKLSKIIKELKIQKYAKLLGKIEDNLLRYLYRISNVVIIPSIFEGIPTVLLEAMYYNKKIIITNLPEIKNFIKDQKDALIIPINDSKHLKQAIISILDDKVKNLGKEGRKKIIKHFTWEIISKNISEIYREII